jgi:TolB-like protein/Tfp pilus assembly protein PilF
MKRCPQCRRDYFDDSLLYCLDDGSALLDGPGGEAATAIFGHPIAAPTQRRRKYLVYLVVPVAILAVVTVGLLAVRSHVSRTAKRVDSLAVLPFENTAQDRDQEYLSDGVTESLINSLSQIDALRVINRNSVFRYRNIGGDPADIGRQLGVQAVLTGRITPRDDYLTVSTELVNVADSKQIWGQQYNFRRPDLMQVQSEIARQISDQLFVKLTGEEKVRLAKRYTESTDAYLLYTRGRFFWDKRNAEGMEQARAAYNKAIELDANYALAYAGLADAYLFCYCKIPRQEAIALARKYAEKALSLDNDLAEAHVTLAFIEMNYDFDWTGSIREFETAIRLNPGYSVAHQFYGVCLVNQGRADDGLLEARRALELDPLSLAVNWSLGMNLYNARRYDDAIAQLGKTVQMDPKYHLAHGSLGYAYLAKGMYDKALAEFQIARDLLSAGPGDPSVGIILAYIRMGRRQEAAQSFEEFRRPRDQNSDLYDNQWYGVAKIYVSLEDSDEAIRWLETGLERHSFNMFFLGVDPGFDQIRGDLRFAEIVKKIGLTGPNS